MTFCLLPFTFCLANVPPLIHYQGRLTEANQAPLVGAHTVTLRIYDAETGGASLWQETHSITLTSEDRGIFSVLLGSLKSFGTLTFNQPLWLSIEVDGEGEMRPRQRFTAVGYAINADTLDGLRSDQFLRSDVLATVARADHAHQGVHSLSVSGQPALVGDVALAAGSNVTLSQSGQAITIAAAAEAGASGNRVTEAASNAVTIGTASDTNLLSVTITKSQAGSALLVLASVQLTHAGPPTTKTVDVKLLRDGTPLDSAYTVRLGTVNQAVSDVPVTLHAWDASGAGTYTFTLQARSSGNGAAATVRRVTVVELL